MTTPSGPILFSQAWAPPVDFTAYNAWRYGLANVSNEQLHTAVILAGPTNTALAQAIYNVMVQRGQAELLIDQKLDTQVKFQNWSGFEADRAPNPANQYDSGQYWPWNNPHAKTDAPFADPTMAGPGTHTGKMSGQHKTDLLADLNVSVKHFQGLLVVIDKAIATYPDASFPGAGSAFASARSTVASLLAATQAIIPTV